MMNPKSLTEVASDLSCRIVKIGGDHRFLSRVTSMGFTVGAPLRMLQNCKRLPLLVYLRDTQIAIDRQEAAKIYVEDA